MESVLYIVCTKSFFSHIVINVIISHLLYTYLRLYHPPHYNTSNLQHIAVSYKKSHNNNLLYSQYLYSLCAYSLFLREFVS